MELQTENRRAIVERTLSEVLRWVEGLPICRGLAIVGSHARGTAREDSDVDLVLLVKDLEPFLSADWIAEIDWRSIGAFPESHRFVQYGVVWSNHVRLANACDVEFAFAPLSWAEARPVDFGTRRIILDGCRVLYDPEGLLHTVCSEVSKGQHESR